MNRIKLGIINSTPFMTAYGGVGPFIKNLDPFLSKEFEVNYITLPPFLNNLNFLPKRLVFLIYLFFRMNKIKKNNVILSHVPEGSFIATFTNIPLVHIFHGNHNPMTQSRFWFGKYFEFFFIAFEKRIQKKAKLLYTVGNERENVLKLLNPIYHSIPVKSFEMRSGFIFAGRLEKIKNIDKIIKIYSLLDDKIIKNNLLFIAGTGTQEQHLKQMVAELNLSDKIVFTGEMSNNKLIEIVSGKRITLMASSQEGLPMAIAESLSVGVPVISTNTGDISRAIKDGYNGFLFPIEFDLNAYIEKIKYILNNYELFASNALKSSEMFKAENVAYTLTCDIKKVVVKN